MKSSRLRLRNPKTVGLRSRKRWSYGSFPIQLPNRRWIPADKLEEHEPLKEVALTGIPIGQLLVEQGALTQRQVDHILKIQKQSHRPFGDLAERLYGINPRAVEDAWVEQYTRAVGIVDLDAQQMDEECLRLLNRRQAWQFHVLPVNRDVDTMNLATSPENLVRAVNFSTRKLDEPISFVLAERQQLREFLMKHYPVPDHIAEFATKL
jgi:hypothetical protein